MNERNAARERHALASIILRLGPVPDRDLAFSPLPSSLMANRWELEL